MVKHQLNLQNRVQADNSLSHLRSTHGSLHHKRYYLGKQNELSQGFILQNFWNC